MWQIIAGIPFQLFEQEINQSQVDPRCLHPEVLIPNKDDSQLREVQASTSGLVWSDWSSLEFLLKSAEGVTGPRSYKTISASSQTHHVSKSIK